MWSEPASSFLLVFGLVAGIVFAIPILVAPLAWARAFRWNLPDDTDLAVYFGRCLGVLAVVLSAFAIRAGVTGDGVQQMFRIVIPVFVGMTLVHVWGAIRGTQPLSETIEIIFWAGLILLGLLFCPA